MHGGGRFSRIGGSQRDGPSVRRRDSGRARKRRLKFAEEIRGKTEQVLRESSQPVIPIPNRCIWCKKSPPEVGFNVNHVLPECVGNKNQQVLPVGVVCSTCNSYFGAKVEPKLLADPYFHVIAVTLSLVDPDDMNVFRSRIFDDQHQPTETVKANLSMHADLSARKLSLDIDYRISGNLGKEYSPKDLAWLSRAAHKIGFEALAWVHYVRGTEGPENIFSAKYDVVRAWARHGQPQNAVRPVLRRMSDQLKAEVDV